MPSESGENDLYVSTEGNDDWSGRLPQPNADGSDGPLATVARARDILLARRRPAGGGRERRPRDGALQPVTVWLRGGRYEISEPLEFRPEDSGPVAYAAWPGEQPILDAGKRIEGWRSEILDDKEVWVADLPEVAAGEWYFRQLFVNGRRRPRPRLPKDGCYLIESVPGIDLAANIDHGSNLFCAAPGDFHNWSNLTDIEVVVLHWWIEERLPVASFDEATRTVTCTHKSLFALKDDQGAKYARYYVDNVFEALSEAGEWYLDRVAGRLYYLPLPEESVETAEVFAPVTAQFLKLTGNSDENEYVESLRFEGLSFRHGACRRRRSASEGGSDDASDPAADYGASVQAAVNVPGAICLQGARNCAIEDCTIEHIGWYGIELADGCTGNRIVGNEIRDMGAGGVKLNGADANGPRCRRTGDNQITDNHIHGGGRIFHSAVGILSAHSFGNDLSHNHIHDLFYTGISCGWAWGYMDNVSKDNYIEKNHIHDLGFELLSDLGGVYLLGVQPGTVVRGNVIHDINHYNYGAWAIYPDQGCSHVLIENNICYRTNGQIFSQHFGRENIVRNNIFAFGADGIVGLGRAQPHNNLSVERNILVTDNQPIYIGGYQHPLEQPNFRTDLNLLWDVSGRTPKGGRNGVSGESGRQTNQREFSFVALQKLGYDRHSLVADPRFKDLKGLDFMLQEDSPAFALGFRPIDTSDVGPRPKGKREPAARIVEVDV